MNVDAHQVLHSRTYGTEDMGGSDTFLRLNSMSTRTDRDVRDYSDPGFPEKDKYFGNDSISAAHTQNAHLETETSGSKLPLSLALSLCKISPPNGMHLRPIMDRAALRIPVRLPPLKDVI